MTRRRATALPAFSGRLSASAGHAARPSAPGQGGAERPLRIRAPGRVCASTGGSLCTDVDRPRGLCGGIKRRRHLDDRHCMSVLREGLEMAFSGVAESVGDLRVVPSAKEGAD
jgi:hypothetical protein